MKTKLIFLLLFLSLYIFNCSESESPNVCFIYSLTISDDCNCVNYDCETYFILDKNKKIIAKPDEIEDVKEFFRKK
jgi:hypothetical protein